MTKLSRPGSLTLTCSLLILSVCLIALVVKATEISGFFEPQNAKAQNSNSQNSNSTATRPRRPLPRPTADKRFERYAGQDSPSRLNRGGASRETINPRRPLAPLEGRAYDARPFFTWEIARRAKVYHFEIYEGDPDKASAKPVYQTDLTVAELKYPQDAPILQPGILYSWRVSTPSVEGKDVLGDVATLIILAGDDLKEVQKALVAAELTSPKTREDRLDQARAFELYGVWYDALEIVSELAKDPGDKDALKYRGDLLDKLEPKP